MPKSKQVPRKIVKMNLSLRESQGNIPSILPEIDMCQETIPIPMEILPMKERSKKAYNFLRLCRPFLGV
jgi:hypothetical protein